MNNQNNANNNSMDNGPNPAKRQRRDDEEVRLLIPSKLAGAVIGKGGHNIQKLRTEYKAQVNVGDCQGPERVITIGADLDTCCKVIKDIMKHFDKEPQGNVEEYELRMLLHQSLAGCVIGKGGSKIKELKDKIGCRLKIFSNIAPQSTDRIAQIIGKEDQCLECLIEITDLLKTTPIKGPVHNYDPHNYDDMFADEYGGYGNGMGNGFRNGGGGGGGGGGSRGGDRGGFGGNRGGGDRSFGDRGDRGGNRGGFGERRGGGGMDRGGRGGGNNGGGMNRDYVDPWAHNGSNNGGGMQGGMTPLGGMGNFGGLGNGMNSNNGNGMGGNGMGGMGSMGGNLGGGNNQGNGGSFGGNQGLGGMGGNGNGGNGNGGGNGAGDMDGKTSTQVTIPKDLAGAIIGKGGGRIRRIRSESNAFIQIDEALPGSSDRIITITGTPKQIQAAQYMLQQR
ncbi:unnamed protein product [Diamesa hyperborea]